MLESKCNSSSVDNIQYKIFTITTKQSNSLGYWVSGSGRVTVRYRVRVGVRISNISVTYRRVAKAGFSGTVQVIRPLAPPAPTTYPPAAVCCISLPVP